MLFPPLVTISNNCKTAAIAAAGESSWAELAALLYGVSSSYVFFLVTFLYAIGFVGNLAVPKSIDCRRRSVLARRARHRCAAAQRLRHPAQRHGASVVQARLDKGDSASRSSAAPTCCSRACALILLFWQWRSMTGIIWQVASGIGRSVLIWALFGLGWLTVLASTFLVDHFDLFGLRQVTRYLRGTPYSRSASALRCSTASCATRSTSGSCSPSGRRPTMTQGHLLFARGHHRLHPHRHSVRGARPDQFLRRCLPPVPAAHADDRAVHEEVRHNRRRCVVRSGGRVGR